MKPKYFVCLLLFAGLTGFCWAQQIQPLNNASIKKEPLDFKKLETDYSKVQNELKQLEQQKTQLLTLLRNFNEQQKQVLIRIEKLEKSYDEMGSRYSKKAVTGGSVSQNQLLAATKQMQETQMSFNQQYLQLQSQMQQENRSYTAVSNIMKTKHETVKNSISNIR